MAEPARIGWSCAGSGLTAICGVLPEERDRAQPLEIDLDLWADLSAAGRSDDLADTVDYGAVCGRVAEVCASGCAAAARTTRRPGGARRPRARPASPAWGSPMRKLRPPVAPPARDIGCARGPWPRRDGRVTRALLGLGSNLGDRTRFLRDAVESLGSVVVAVSPVYETEPVGGPGGQGAYLNLVVELDTTLSPRELLAVAQAPRSAADRVRDVRWGPRTLDVDVLWIDGVTLDSDTKLDGAAPAGCSSVASCWPRWPTSPPELVDAEQLLHAAGSVTELGPLWTCRRTNRSGGGEHGLAEVADVVERAEGPAPLRPEGHG